jgi:hypothetical protein
VVDLLAVQPASAKVLALLGNKLGRSCASRTLRPRHVCPQSGQQNRNRRRGDEPDH